MLDSFSLALLNVITLNSSPSVYKVFSNEFLMGEMPKELVVSENKIREGLSFLFERDYISVKYQDEKEACISPTQKGRLVFESRIDQEIEYKEAKRKYFFFAFLGAFSGGLIASVLAFILGLVLG